MDVFVMLPSNQLVFNVIRLRDVGLVLNRRVPGKHQVTDRQY